MSNDPSTGKSVSLDALLRIDIHAAIRKLSDAQLQGSWQLGAECVRLAVQCQAQQIKIVTGARKLSLHAQGAGLRSERLRDLSKILDSSLSAHARHAALERLESCAHPVLLVLLSQSIDAITMTLEHPSGRRRLVYRRGQKPQQQRQSSGSGRVGFKIELKIRDLDRRMLRESLHDLCRFCSVPIKVDGRTVAAALPEGLSQCRVQEPLPGVLTLPEPGNGSRVWLLQNGVIRANLSLPARPWFVAALELSGKVPADATPADLRLCFERELPRLIEASIALLRRTIKSEQSEATLPSLRHWVLEAARVPELLPKVETLAVFPFHAPRESRTLRSLTDLALDLEDYDRRDPKQGARRQGPAATIDPRDLAGRVHHDTPLIEIEARAQPLLCELLQHRYSAAPAIVPSSSLRAATARLRARLRSRGGLRKSWGRIWTRLVSRLGPRVASQSLPRPLQEAFAQMQAMAGSQRRVELCARGRFPAWRGSTLIVPVLSAELRHWSALDPRQRRAKELIWRSLCALRRSKR